MNVYTCTHVYMCVHMDVCMHTLSTHGSKCVLLLLVLGRCP